MLKLKNIIITLFCITRLSAQENDARLSIKLATFGTAMHPNVSIVITNNATGQKYTTQSNSVGIAQLALPSNAAYTAQPANYSGNHIFTIPPGPIVYAITITYDTDDLSKAKQFEPTDAEQKAQNNYIKSLPNSIDYTKTIPKTNPHDTKNSQITLEINDLYGKPLAHEKLMLVGQTFGKKYIAKTNELGKCLIPVAKGDVYAVCFKHDSNYTQLRIKMSSGWSKQSLQFEYIGTLELEKRQKEKELAIKKRMIEEEKERKRYAQWLITHKKDIIEQTKKEIQQATKDPNYYKKSIVNQVIDRNHWQNKLIVCDLTGSMQPYRNELLAWYMLNHLKDQKMQFVFFNDGDNKTDDEKVMGNTGGIYYFQSKGIDSLILAAHKVSGAGNGGDCPENNIEAILYATKTAQPHYQEILMIADNNAPIKDLELLSKLNKPIHVILCGALTNIEEDYLRLAYATKGSVHTIEKDILDLAKLTNGQTISINGIEYKMLNGKFFALNKV